MSEEVIRGLLESRFEVNSIHQSGPYALAHVVYKDGDSEGTVLLRNLDEDWRELADGGGGMSSYEMYVYGVPQEHWPVLLGSDEFDMPERETPTWWDTAERPLQIEDIGHLPAWELTLMRNEIFARHGCPFAHDPLLREYFDSRPWYQVDPAYSESKLSDLERRNAKMIHDLQKKLRKEF
jgi:hypothetical protein